GDFATNVPALGLERRQLRVGADCYRRLHSGQLQNGVHSNRAIHTDGDVALRKIGKARHTHGDRVRAGGDVGKTVQTLFIRLRAASEVDLLINDGYFRASRRAVRLVGDIADQRSV